MRCVYHLMYVDILMNTKHCATPHNEHTGQHRLDKQKGSEIKGRAEERNTSFKISREEEIIRSVILCL